MNFKTALSFDDVLIVPKYSEIVHRENIDLSSSINKSTKLMLPLISAP
ncbi:MAG: IMP dehydrogenase, partial [Nanoarchaeota archaeon]